jgi:hypothetical protein
MTDTELTAVSTFLWVVATVSLFILLAGWSTGASWGISSGIVNGLRGWTHRGGLLARASSSAGELPPLRLPPEGHGRASGSPRLGDAPTPIAEIEDLRTRGV